MLRYVIFCQGNERRLFTLVNGQPYYQSLGRGLSLKDLWVPFIMLGFRPHNNVFLSTDERINALFVNLILFSLDVEKAILHFDRLTSRVREFDVKSVNKTLAEDIPGRFVTKEHLITALRLSHAVVPSYKRDEIKRVAGLNEEECLRVENPLKLADEPDLITDDPDKINLWLLQNGAHELKQLIKFNESFSEFFAALVTQDNFDLIIEQFVREYTQDLYQPLSDRDQLCKEACTALQNLAEEVKSMTREQLQAGQRVREVMEDARSLGQTTREFLQNEMGSRPLTGDKRSALMNFCLHSVDQLRNKRRKIDMALPQSNLGHKF